MSGNNHNYKRRLNHYKLVNKCETLKELSKAILEIAKDNNNIINGRLRHFDAKKMAERCLRIDELPLNVLTRNYGIRQQAIYILYSESKLVKRNTNSVANLTVGEISKFIKDIIK